MKTNNHKIVDYDEVLDNEFGAVGTQQRAQAEERAYNFYSGQILLEARKEAQMTQSEVAEKIKSSKSYISRVENGTIIPSVGTFYRIVNALGMRVEILPAHQAESAVLA